MIYYILKYYNLYLINFVLKIIKMSKNKDKKKEEKEIKSIKFGIIVQNTNFININELFQFYFNKANPNIIKNELNEYEFTINDNDDLHYIYRVIPENAMKNLVSIYNSLNFFLIFIDIESSTALKNLESYIDLLISCSDDITKKSYIFGAYKDSKKIINKDEKISSILNCKGIDYEYSEININLDEDFPKGVEYILEDSKDIMEEYRIEEIRNKLEKDKDRSCDIF